MINPLSLKAFHCTSWHVEKRDFLYAPTFTVMNNHFYFTYYELYHIFTFAVLDTHLAQYILKSNCQISFQDVMIEFVNILLAFI